MKLTKTQRKPYEKMPPPAKLDNSTWFYTIINSYIIDMTRELHKDAYMKIMSIRIIQDTYKGLPAYELGTVAAGIEENFKKMLKLYRFHSNITTFVLPENHEEHNDYKSVLNALFVVQGEYNKIRLEKDLFKDLREKQVREKLAKAEKYAKIMNVTFSSNAMYYKPGNKFVSNRPSPPTKRTPVQWSHPDTPPKKKNRNLFRAGNEADVARRYALKDKIGNPNSDVGDEYSTSDVRGENPDLGKDVDFANSFNKRQQRRFMHKITVSDIGFPDKSDLWMSDMSQRKNPVFNIEDSLDYSRMSRFRKMQGNFKRSTKKPLWRPKID